MKQDTILLLGALGVGGFLIYNSGILQNLGKQEAQIGGAVSGAVGDVGSIISGVSDLSNTVTGGVNTALQSFFGGVNNFLSPQTQKYPMGTTSYATVLQLQSSVSPTQVGGGNVSVAKGTPSGTTAFYTPVQNSSGLAIGSSVLKNSKGQIIGGYTPALGSTYATVKK